MGKTIIYNFLRFFILVILQVAVLKNIGYYSLAVMFPYILIIFLLPIGLSNLALFLISFSIGLAIDSFYDSIGVHASACVMLAFFRIFFHNITLEVDEKHSFNTPSWGIMGFKWFSTYIALGTLIHHFTLFLIETFSFRNIGQTFISIVLSTISTIIVIFIISLLTYKSKSRIISQ